MAHFYTRFSFILGVLFGIFLAVYFKKSALKQTCSNSKQTGRYEEWFKTQGYKRNRVNWDELRYSNKSFYSESQYLFDKVKILCIILVKAQKNLNAASNTWGKGCNKIQPVMLESQNKIMPRKQTKDRSSWALLCHVLNTQNILLFDWVVVVKDMTFIITENLRFLIAPLNKKKKHYLGHAMRFWGTIYNSGDAGFVLSQGAVKRFQKNINIEKCTEYSYWNREDYYLGKYLSMLNITPINTVDDEGLSMFHPYSWYHAFYPGEGYFQNSFFPYKCCSQNSISFKASEGDKMYTYHYLFYKLQIFTHGSLGSQRRIISELEDKKVWMEFLRDHKVHDENITSDSYYKLWEDLINDPTSFSKNIKKEDLFDY